MLLPYEEITIFFVPDKLLEQVVCSNLYRPGPGLDPNGEDCDQYELRMYDPPTDTLTRLNVSVRFSGDVQVIQATLGSELAAAGGYSLDVDNPPTIPRVNINRSDINNGFTLPNTTSSWLTLFIFSFAGTPNSTVTAEIDASIGGQVLGSFPFTDPWQYVAADFNLDNAITTVDQISIRKAILFGEFPANFQAWRLIAADGWPAGVYFYQWVEGNAIHTGKLIKQ